MSELQAQLAALGALVIVAIVGWNAWTTWRARPRASEPGAEAGAAADSRRDPAMDGADAPPQGLGAGSLSDRRTALDGLIDSIASIAVETEVYGDAALAAMPATRRVGSKAIAFEGQRPAQTEWEPVVAGVRYRAYRVGIQLANRAGAMNEIEFSEFSVKAHAFAEALGGHADVPDMQAEVARARELDEFASQHDAQLNFTIRSPATAWSPGFVQQMAARAGFVLGALPGRMVLPGQTPASPVLGLAFDTQAALADDPEASALRSVRLTLDVPQVARSERPFVRLRESVQALAASMDGRVTDDTGRELTRETMDAIGADLESLYDRLEARDLAAGSPQARRLFA